MKKETKTLLLAILVSALVLSIGCFVTYENYKEFEKACDELHGKGNWVWVEVTGNVSHIGQAWKCVGK